LAFIFICHFSSNIRPDYSYEFGPTLEEIKESLALPQDIMKVEFKNELWTYRLFSSGHIKLIIYNKKGGFIHEQIYYKDEPEERYEEKLDRPGPDSNQNDDVEEGLGDKNGLCGREEGQLQTIEVPGPEEPPF